MNNKPVAIITARSGSKRLPNKNILDFSGQPMILWTIDAAKESGVFDKILVTSDSKKILEIADARGVETHLRDIELSDDKASLADVLSYMISSNVFTEDKFCLLLPNCPLRDKYDIQKSWGVFSQGNASAVLSVVDFSWTPPFRALEETEDGLKFFDNSYKNKKSQLYPDVVCASGAIYWGYSEKMKGRDSLYCDGLFPFKLPWHKGIDIDTAEDFNLACALKFAQENGFEFEVDEC